MKFKVFRSGCGDTGLQGEGTILEAIKQLEAVDVDREAVLYVENAPVATKHIGQERLSESEKAKLVKEFWDGEE